MENTITNLLKPILSVFTTSPERYIAHYTINRCRTLDTRLGVKRLVPETNGANSSRFQGAQETVVTNLFEDILSDTNVPVFRTLVLTGEAGVGKSTSLRAISVKLAIRFLGRRDQVPLLPVALPLQQVTLPADLLDDSAMSSAEAGEKLLWYLLEYWCTWVSGLGKKTPIKLSWLTTWLQEHPSVLILDGLDEFFINNVKVDSEMIVAMLNAFGRILRDGTVIKSHTALLAIRNSYPGHHQFATRTSYVYLIKKLTTSQASLIYPHMTEVLQNLRDTTILDVLLSPLIISSIGRGKKEISAESLQTKSLVMRSALDALLDESNVLAKIASSGTDNMSNVRTTLSIIGWLFFHGNKGIMYLSEIQAESQILADDWEAQVPWLKNGDERGDQILRAFQLLANEEAIKVLMERTVFVSTGVNQWRFAHREWQDYLTALYIANAYYFGNFAQMNERALTRAIFKLIGEILLSRQETFEITGPFTDKLLEVGRLAAVNLAGVIGNSSLVVHPQAIQRFLSIDMLDRLDRTARLIVFTAVFYRALKQDPNDASAADLRRAVLTACNEYGRGQNSQRDAVSASLAWCYHRAMAALSNNRINPPRVPWPGLRFEPEHEEPVLSMLSAGADQGFQIEPRHRSLQVAFLQILPIVAEDPYRPISIMHYLYTLVVAYRHGAHIPEVSRELPRILADDSRYATIFREYTMVPELWTLFANCQAAYNTASISESERAQ